MKLKITLDNTATRMSKLLTNEIDGEVLLLHIDAEKYYNMDAVGSRIWQLLEQPFKVDALCNQLAAEYQVDSATCQGDVLEFLQTLSDAKLVEVS